MKIKGENIMCNNCGNDFNRQLDGCRNHGCDNRHCEKYEDNRREALENLEFDIRMVRCGIEDIKKGICKIMSGCVCDGIECVKIGACNMELGINNLIRRFESGCFDVGCKTKRMIEEAICSLKEAVCLTREGIEAILKGCIKEGIALLKRAICNAEEGLCDLEKALRNVC